MESSERRRAKRLVVSRQCKVGIGGEFLQAGLADLSEIGARLIIGKQPEIGTEVELQLDPVGSLSGHVVRHTEDGIALYFDTTTTMAAAFLRNTELVG
ncbi:MAG: PilZ domain-containing protein [Sphingomonadales bacterium]|nr:PilZ domain-containing protein [Sphingomonadales bacterium]